MADPVVSRHVSWGSVERAVSRAQRVVPTGASLASSEGEGLSAKGRGSALWPGEAGG